MQITIRFCKCLREYNSTKWTVQISEESDGFKSVENAKLFAELLVIGCAPEFSNGFLQISSRPIYCSYQY